MGDINDFLNSEAVIVEPKNNGKNFTANINQATVAIIQAYLKYAGDIVRDVLAKEGYDPHFKEIDDDLIIKPDELVVLINKIQNALYSAKD